MRRDIVHNAIKLLTDIATVKAKHLPRRHVDPKILSPDKSEEVHAIKSEKHDTQSVRKITLKTKGGAGPSKIDAEVCKRLFRSTQFRDVTTDLWNTFAEVIKNLCSA